jgi:hypothetical protein
MNKKVAPAGAIMIVLVIATLVGLYVWNKCEEVSNSAEALNVATTNKKATKVNQNENQTQTQAVSTNDETAGWKTYSNSKYNFSLKYPKDIEFIPSLVCGGEDGNDSAPESCSGVDILIGENHGLVHIDVLSKDKKLSLGDFVKKALSFSDSDVEDQESIKINNKEAITLKFKGGIELSLVQDFVKEKTQILFISLSPSNVMYVRYALEKCFIERDGKRFDSPCTSLETSLYAKIISTLKFTK